METRRRKSHYLRLPDSVVMAVFTEADDSPESTNFCEDGDCTGGEENRRRSVGRALTEIVSNAMLIALKRSS
jgi:hypothetical protein